MKRKLSLGDRSFNVMNGFLFGIFALICFFPFYYIIINTISDNRMVTRGAILFFPQGIHFGNYQEVFRLSGLYEAALISVARTVSGTLVSVLGSSFMGYAMSRKEYWHQKFWYRFIIVTMYFNAGVIPVYLNMKNLGLLNNFLVYIIPGLVSPFNMILVKTYIESIPTSLEESAEIDGAGYLRRFIQLIMPLAKPIVATIAIFSAVNQWNSFMDSILYMTGNRFATLQSLLYRYLNEVNSIAELMKSNSSMTGANLQRTLTPVSVRFTITVITVLPILLIYPIFQRYFVKGMMIGAVKG